MCRVARTEVRDRSFGDYRKTLTGRHVERACVNYRRQPFTVRQIFTES